MLCNILHRYLQQADYSVIEEATMVSTPPSALLSLHGLMVLRDPNSAALTFRGFLSFVTQNDGVPALVTLKKGLVALARQWMKFIVVTQGFKAIGLMRPNQLAKPKEPQQSEGDITLGLDNGAALPSDTSADGAEFEFDAGANFHLSVCSFVLCPSHPLLFYLLFCLWRSTIGPLLAQGTTSCSFWRFICCHFCEATVSEHTMLLEGVCSRPPPKDANSGPVSGVEIMRKLSKSHTHNESALRIKVQCICWEAAVRHLGLCSISSPLEGALVPRWGAAVPMGRAGAGNSEEAATRSEGTGRTLKGRGH